jgi:hypothetical protein
MGFGDRILGEHEKDKRSIAEYRNIHSEPY